MISRLEIQETNRMIEESRLDVRTITMGISLLGCAGSDPDAFNRSVYERITSKAGNLVEAGDEIGRQYGLPIVNKRISVTPIAIAASGLIGDPEDGGEDSLERAAEIYAGVARTLDRAAKASGVNFIGGFTALVQKGSTFGDRALMRAIPRALAETERVCASVNAGSTRGGINMNAVRRIGRMLIEMAELTKDRDAIACAKFVAFCNAVEDNPFMAGAFHGTGERDAVINVGVSGPGVVKRALEEVRGADFETLCETVKRTAFKITRVGQLVAQEASRRLNVPFGIIDLSLAPTPEVGDSVAEILIEMGLEQPGAPGTTAALAILTDNIKKGGVMASSCVGGLSGAFIPVSEDHGMIGAARAGALTLEKLEAMTCVCSVGLDMVAVPGDTPAATLSGIIADEMAIGMVNNKTTAVRIIPVPGKTVGDEAVFGGLLGSAPVMRVNPFGCAGFIERGGRIPPPIHSFRN
ncbi:MAG: PFL family protein [Oscillospiraceae bacterium]|nr:PFL family protein [Oscillospiraceae bacterium]